MGRYTASTSNTALDLDPKLRRQAAHWALGRGLTLCHMVEQGLRLITRKGGRG